MQDVLGISQTPLPLSMCPAGTNSTAGSSSNTTGDIEAPPSSCLSAAVTHTTAPSDAGGRPRASIPAIDTTTIKLPTHVVHFLRELNQEHDDSNPITEHDASPVVSSLAISLLHMGIMRRSDHRSHSEAFEKISALAHNIVAISKFEEKVSIGKKVENWLINYWRRKESAFQLEIRSGDLTSPLRSFAGRFPADFPERVRIMQEGQEPVQGHSARSVIGQGRRDLSNSPVLADAPIRAAETEEETEIETSSGAQIAGVAAETKAPPVLGVPLAPLNSPLDMITPHVRPVGPSSHSGAATTSSPAGDDAAPMLPPLLPLLLRSVPANADARLS